MSHARTKVIFIGAYTSLYVDGGMNKTTGKDAWGSVVYKEDGKVNDAIGDYKDILDDLNLKNVILPAPCIERKIVISNFSDVKTQQNNGAELLAMLIALRISKYNLLIKQIFSDSDLVIKYWSIGHYNATTVKDPKKVAYINECMMLRKLFEKNGGKIVKIGGKENPADLGYHR